MPEANDPTNLSGLEASLSKLTPCEPRLDRDSLMYLAGQASVRERSARTWLWPLATAASLVVSATLGLMLAARSSPPSARDAPQVAVRTNQASGDYLRLRTLVLAEGVEALPATPPHTSSTPIETRALWRELRGI